MNASAGIGESRWPPVLVLLAFMALNIAIRAWLANETAIRVPWLLPAIESVLVVALVARLLATRALVWLGNNLGFSLLYGSWTAAGRSRAHTSRRPSTSPSRSR
jgi:hypothetical protein